MGGNNYNDEIIMKKHKWQALRCDYTKEIIAEMIQLTENNKEDSFVATEAFFKWQYIDTPAGRAIIWLAIDDKCKIIGQVCFLPIRVKLKDEDVLGAYALNILVDSASRNKGIFAVLARKAFDEMQNSNIKVVYGFPNKFAYPTWIKRTSFKDLGVIPDLIKIININRFVRKKISNGLIRTLISLIYKVFLLSLHKNKPKDLQVQRIEEFNDNFNASWTLQSKDYKNMIVRSKDYLNWRYFYCPTRKYEVFCCKNNKNEIQGYVVLRIISEGGLNVGWIVDIFSGISKSGEKASEVLIIEAQKYFIMQNVDIVRCVVSENSIGFKALRKNGFLRTPRTFKLWPIKIIMNIFDNKYVGEQLVDHWFFTLGDNDAI